MNETAISIMQVICVLCVIGAMFSMMAYAVLSYRILAASALVVGSLLGFIAWGAAGGVGVLVFVFIGLPIVCLGVVNLVLWFAWQATRKSGFSQEPSRTPGGFISFANIYRGILLSTG